MPSQAGAGLKAADFWRASRAFTLVWLAHLGRRHGLLRELGGARGGLTPQALAARAGRHKAAVRLWCEAAAAMGLVAERGGRFALPRALVPLLVDESRPEYLGGHLDYLALRSLDYDAFDELFRDGRPSARPQRHLVEAFAHATKWDHTAFLEVFLPEAQGLLRTLRRGADILDVGAGTGAWSFRVASAFPRSRITGVEPDRTALRLARAGASKLGLDGRVQFELGDGETMKFDSRFDLVFLGEVLCAAPQDARILRGCAKALRPGGALVIAEGLIDESASPRDPGNALVIAMRLEFALQGARFCTRRELATAVRRAGLGTPSFVAAGGGFYFALARRR
jgi:SAM-dependent methyltransferase